MGAGTILPGPSQSTSHSPSWSGWGAAPYISWTADVAGWVDGQFMPNQFAVGISLLALRDAAGAPKYEWWFQIVYLQ